MNTAGNFVDYNYNIYPLKSHIETNYNYDSDKYNNSVVKFSNNINRPFKLKRYNLKINLKQRKSKCTYGRYCYYEGKI